MTGLPLRLSAAFLVLVIAGLIAGESFVAALAVGALAIVLGSLIAWSVLRNLRQIGDVASRIAGGDFSARVGRLPAGEVGALADAFNHMAARVEEQVAAAAQQRSRLEAALQSSADAFLALDAETRVLFANQAAERLFQQPAQSIVGNPFVWLVPNEDVLLAVRDSHERGESRATVVERPGRHFLQAVTTPIRGGGDWAVLVVFHDLSDVRRTEQMRRDFVTNVSHELRTPLASIKAVIETLEGGAIEEPEVARDFLGRADAEVDRLIQLVEELLELSRIEAGDLPLAFVPTDIPALLGDLVGRLRPLAERRKLTLSLAADGAGSVEADAARIERAVGNLVHNAIKFTPEGGSVAVSASRMDDRLVIEVSDTGIGIAAPDLPRVFERFYKVDQSRASVGSGIGLAVVKHTAEAHGGSVSVESEPGRGSRFRIEIPVSRP